MQDAFVGVDVAFAKGKHLPIAICTRVEGRLVPQRLRQLRIEPPIGLGNAATLDDGAIRVFAGQAADYIIRACELLHLTSTRIGIDAPSAPRAAKDTRRAAEIGLDRARISCFPTPSAQGFVDIRRKVASHLATGGQESRIPHANQLWMLVGFELFNSLSRVAPCIEVFPQATAHAIGAAQDHKSREGAVEAQLLAASRYTGWPCGIDEEARLEEIAWGSRHDQLDAYLSAWVASLEEADRTAFGDPPYDAIWIPRIAQPTFPASTVASRPRTLPSSAASRGDHPTVICPACGTKEFKCWPWGWDAHAAHRCTGLTERDPEARKAEYVRRFGQHFGH